MKKIAILVAGAFLLQQLAPTMLWAATLREAVQGTDSSYTFQADENVSGESLPAFGDKPENTFTVDGAGFTFSGDNDVSGFQVQSNETLNLKDMTISGFDVENFDPDDAPPSHLAVANDGTLAINGTVTNDSLIGWSGLVSGDENPAGTVEINGTLDNTNGLIAQNQVNISEGGTFNTDLSNLLVTSLTNNGTLNVGDGSTGEFELTGNGTMNIQGDFRVRDNFSQGTINVESGKVLTLDAANGGVPVSVTSGTLNNEGTVALNQTNDTLSATLNNAGDVQLRTNSTVYANGGTNTGTISGNGSGEYGSLTIQGAYDEDGQTPLAFVNSNTAAGAITVDALTIAAAGATTPAGQFTTNLDAVTLHDGNANWITNNGVLNLTGGTNECEIKGDGNGIVNIVSGTVNNGGTSKGMFTNQAELNISEGATFNNANADAMTFGTLANAGVLINQNDITLTDGSNAGTVEGEGSLLINGEFTNTNATAGAITQNMITVGNGGSVQTNAGAVAASHFVNTGVVVLTGGTNTNVIKDVMSPDFAAAPTAGTTQITGTVINEGNIYQNALQIASTGDLSTELGEGHLKTNTLTNDGTLRVTGGAITGNLAGSSSETAGELVIDGAVTTASGTSIDQNALTINDGKTLTAYNTDIDVGTLTIGEDATFDNAKNLVLTDGTNNGTLTNLAGYTSIYRGEFVNNGLLEQQMVTIGNEEGSALTTAANTVHAAIVNDATLNFTGGANGNTVTGDGTTYILAGADVTNNGSISQHIVIAQADTEHELQAGKLTSHATRLTGAIENNGSLTLTGTENQRVDNTNAITGEGTLTIQNSIVNKADVEQGKVVVAEGNTLVNNSAFTIAAALENSGEIANSGVLTIAGTAQAPSTNTGNIQYEGQSIAGTLKVAGYLENGGNGITQQTVNVLNGGTLVTAADKVTTNSFINDGTIEFNAGNIQHNITNASDDTVTGSVKITGTNMAMDNSGSLKQNGLTVGEGASFTVEQGTVNVANLTNDGTLTADLSKVTVANAFTNNNSLTVTNGNIVNDITGANGSLTVSNGQVQITDGSLNQKSVIIAAATEGEHPTVRGELTAKVGQITATNGIENHGKLTLNGSLEEAVNTVAISGNDGTLKITGDVTNQADITQQTVTVAESVNFTHNAGTITATLENGGTLTNEGTLKINAESNNEGSILGQGNVIIMANGGFDNNGSFAQQSLTINEEGAFTTSLDNLTIADASITNNGEFDLLGGTITNDITMGEGSTGTLGIGGDVILNEGTKINQKDLLVANIPAGEDPAIIGTLTANASDITITGTFTNDHEMTFMGGENNNAITGNGNLIIGGDLTDVQVTNAAGKQIANTVEITTGNHLLAQAGDLTNTVTNTGKLTLSGTDAVNVAQIAGNGELVIDGTIQNTDGKTIANAITINADKSLKANAADVLNSVTNEGIFKISGGALDVAVANAANDTTTGTVEITGTNITIGENGSIKQNKLTIANGSSFASDMQESKLLVASIENNGAFNVTGDLATAISGTGTLNIEGTLENKANVEQNIVTIANGKTFTTNGNNVTASQEITNNGILALTGGTNNNMITGNGQVEIAGDVVNSNGKTISTALTIDENSRLQANAADIQTGITNEGTYTVTGGAIGYDVLNQAQDTHSGEVVINGAGVSLAGSLHQNKLTVSGGDFTADMADIEVATLQNDATFNVSGDIATDITGQGNLTIASSLKNTANIKQTTVTVDDGVNFTTDAGLVTAAINNEAGQVTFTGGQNANEITGAGTVVVDGDVTTTGTIANAITVNTDKSLTATAEKLLGTVTNNGTVALTGGELAQSIAGGITQIKGNVSLGNNATAFHTLNVDNGGELAMNQVHATVDNATINGTLNMSIASIADGSTEYEGAKLTAANGVTLGSNSGLKLTFINNDLTTGQTTGELSLIEGDVTGDWAQTLSNNRYKVTANKGKAVVSYTTSAEEIAQEAGANSNEVAAAGAWDKEDASNPNSTAYKLQDLSQNNAAGYVEALEDLTPVQVAMVKANVTNLNQSIYTAANNHMQYGGTGMAAGDMFSYKSVWMQGLYGKAKNNVHGGFDGDTYGGAVGLDLTAGDESTLGIGYAYAYSSLNAEGKKIKADTQNVFLYGNYTGLADWYFDATLGYNFGKYKETKNVFGVGTGKGDYHVNSFAAQAMAQYQLTEYLAPLAGLRYVYANQGAYDDGFGQHIKSTSDNTLTALLGAKAGHNFQAGKFVFKPEVKVAALFDVMQHGDNVTVSTGSNSYSVKTEQLKKFGVETGVGLGVDLSDHVEFSLGYDGQFRSHYYNHTGSAKLKYSF